MGDSDRELRDLLEQAQGDLKRARAELAEATATIDRLQAQSTEALQAHVASLEADLGKSWQQLERADTMREDWSQRFTRLEQELSAARGEQLRLRRQLEALRDERALRAKPGLSFSALLRRR